MQVPNNTDVCTEVPKYEKTVRTLALEGTDVIEKRLQSTVGLTTGPLPTDKSAAFMIRLYKCVVRDLEAELRCSSPSLLMRL